MLGRCAASLGVCAVLLVNSPASAKQPRRPSRGFFDGATVDLTALNYYYNRDFRSGDGPGQRTEWAQGLLVQAQSGWTPGFVGVGLDAMAVADAKLDGTADEVGIGLLQAEQGGVRRAYGRVGLTGRARIGETVLRLGTLIPKEPVLTASTSRIMPQTFKGVALQTRDLGAVNVSYARYSGTWYRDGVGNQPLTVFNKNGRFQATPAADHFDLVTVSRAWGATKTILQSGQLQGIYRQDMVGLDTPVSVADGTLQIQARWFQTRDVGRAMAGPIDNRMLNAMLSYERGAHGYAVGLQRLSGHSAMPWVNGTDGGVFNWTFINDFLEVGEASWQGRYTFDGDQAGLPGWTFMARYVRGRGARPASVPGEGREWQRDLQVEYRFQRSALRRFSISWLNGTMRSNYQRDAEENRLILRYDRQFGLPR